jgi:hypothetical protein
MATIVHEPDRSRYVLSVAGEQVGVADYRLEEDVATFTHTFVEPRHRHVGHAAELVAFALDDVRAAGRRATATCWYVTGFLDEHPEYRDLRATGS